MNLFNCITSSENEAEAIRLIESGEDANAKDNNNQKTAMHYAAENGNAFRIHSKVNNLSKIKLIFNEFSTGYDKVVKLLIDKGYRGQINSENKFKSTPLQRASEFGNFSTTKQIVEQLNSRNKRKKMLNLLFRS